MMFGEEGVVPQRVMGLVMHLLREIRENRMELDDVELISKDLLGQGYTESEINAAFTWVFNRLDDASQADSLYEASTSSKSFRVLHPAEHAILKPAAYGQLLEMQTIGMLGLEDTERIIERAMTFGSQLGEEEIRMLVHTYLFEEGPRGPVNGDMQFSQPSSTVH